MINLYSHQKAKVVKVVNEAVDIKRFWLELEGPMEFRFGQFVMARVFGFGEGPFAPCGEKKISGSNIIELTVRKTGILTKKIHELKIGEFIEIRGPFGCGIWPVLSRNLIIVVGGLGLVPLRSLLLDYVKNKHDYKIQVFYGARSPQDMIFKSDFEVWKKEGIDLQLTIDKECAGWTGCVGLVTDLLDKTQLLEDAECFMCGPPVMYKFVAEKIISHGISEEDIYASLERKMHCGVGVCQHCAVGSDYVCKDGPVFKWGEIKVMNNLM